MPSTETFTGAVIPSETDYAEMARRPLEAEQCALIVVDVQEKLLPPIWEKSALCAMFSYWLAWRRFCRSRRW
jgi:hypothetical protein